MARRIRSQLQSALSTMLFFARLKPLVLVELIDKFQMEQCLIFCRTNLDCDLLEQFLIKLGGGR